MSSVRTWSLVKHAESPRSGALSLTTRINAHTRTSVARASPSRVARYSELWDRLAFNVERVSNLLPGAFGAEHGVPCST